ncbi:hypothetical protein ACIBQ1_00285 [Nonomuraea sp. NPDC050153]|uniref:hypothetical protein n=1 Tax=Nonomuraea sp. NPDC050153 TaxID=3364359 RepID=UPI0037A17C37
MNPGNEWEPSTTPYQVPGRRFEPPTQPPTLPPMPPPPPPRRPAWLLPTLAAAIVVLVAMGGVGAYFVVSKVSNPSQPPAAQSERPSGAASSAPVSLDACAMLPADEADRLVPDATVIRDSREGDYTVAFNCKWENRRISFGEFWRSREIDVRIDQHKADGAKTGRAMAQNSYEVDYSGDKYAATAKPSHKPDEKEYISPIKEIQGVGEAAHAQYTWRRSGKLLWYSYGQANARVGDMTIEIKYQAGQQRKDAEILSNETAQSITEDNAIREVTRLAGFFAKGMAAWQAQHPNVLAQPSRSEEPQSATSSPSASATSSPSASATPSPTVLAAFPGECAAITEVASRLVPEPTTRARGTEAGSDAQTECRWLNLEVPGAGEGIKKIRSALITVHRFTNRAGAADESAAKSYYAGERGGDKNFEKSSIGRISWGKVIDLKGMGDQAYQQFIRNRHSEVSASTGTVLVRKGTVVVRIDFSGHQRPEKEPTNSPEVEFMPEKEAMDGAATLAEAFMAQLAKQPGS